MSMKPRQPECLALGLAPGSKDVPILAVGGTDPTLRLWVWDPTAQQFSKGYELHGHEDWIRSLAFCTCPNSDVLLASAGQGTYRSVYGRLKHGSDNYIRLWRLSATATTLQGATAAARSSLRSLIGKGLLIQTAAGATISVTVDSVLSGHEDWVYSVAWRPAERTAADKEPLQRMELLSASMDRTTVLWAPLTETEEQSGEGMWSSKARMGEMGVRTPSLLIRAIIAQRLLQFDLWEAVVAED